MIGRVYTTLFVFAIAFALWYQRVYLNQSAMEFNAQKMAENVVLPIITGQNYNSLSFENGFLKSSFSGKGIVYYSNKHFQATTNLVYQEFHPYSNKADLTVKTDIAFGELMTAQSGEARTLFSKNKLKNATLPNLVQFAFSDNIGSTKNVFVDAVKRNIQSEQFIESHGPSGRIHGIGFFYDMEEDIFILKSNVDGMVIPSQVPKN